MISDFEINEIEARAAATTGVRWRVGMTENGTSAVSIDLGDGSKVQISIAREADAASHQDVDFIANSRDDIQTLVGFLRDEAPLSPKRLEDVARRCDQASPAPWRVFLESDGGVGGGSVIWVSDADEEPDLYLWMGSEPATDADYEFVAAARQDLPRLVTKARKRLSS